MKFSNLKSKRGSVLFIVLLVMSVLIVLASAVYYTVAGQREQVVAEYSGEQAYQTALSVDNIVTSYIVNKKNSNEFKQKILGLAVGASLTTVGDEIDLGTDLGGCKITITRLTNTSYKLVTDVSVNEETARIERVLEMTTAVNPAGFDGRFFTSTGLAPNDTYLTGQTISSKTFFDNEFVMFASGSSNTIQADLICAGTLAFENVVFNCTSPADVIVGNNFINNANQAIDPHGGTFYVGGNFTSMNTSPYGTSSNPVTMYILGDMETKSSSLYGNFYIKGDFDVYSWLTINGNLYVDGTITLHDGVGFNVNGVSYNASNVSTVPTWSGLDTSHKTVDEISAHIKDSLGDPQYFAWGIDDKLSDKPYSIVFDASTNLYTITESGTITECRMDARNINNQLILIDTNIYDSEGNVEKYQVGDIDPDGNTVDMSSRFYNTPKYKDIYLTLQANKIVDGKKYFTWNSNLGMGPWDAGTNNPFVLVKGSGNVIFYLPDGVTYKPPKDSFVMHMGWFYELGGTITFTADKTNVTATSVPTLQGTGAISMAANAIDAHRTIDGEDYETLIKESVIAKYDDRGTGDYHQVYIHTNIFFVSNDVNTSLDLNFQNVGITGFVYAPFMTLELKNNETALSMIGGIIVSDYIMSSTRSFICTLPFDYYHGNKDDLFEDLLNASGDPMGSTVVREWRVVGYN